MWIQRKCSQYASRLINTNRMKRLDYPANRRVKLGLILLHKRFSFTSYFPYAFGNRLSRIFEYIVVPRHSVIGVLLSFGATCPRMR